MITNYQKLLTVIGKWPVNPNKKSRDYGYHLQTLLKMRSNDGNYFSGNAGDTEKSINSLMRLAENKYGLKYPSKMKLGASGMERDDVSVVLTDEFIEYFNKNRGFLKTKFSI